MKIAVLCANGKTGSLITQEALNRGLDVTAVVRGENKSKSEKAIIKDVNDLTTEELTKFDAVVDAFGAWTPETIPGIGDTIISLADKLQGSNTHLIVVGGAGSLFVNPEHTATVDMGPDFPDDWKPLSASHGRGLAHLRECKDLKWTYVSPACDFQAEGARTGHYKLGGEELTLSNSGESFVSYADYAIAIVDEIESGKHIQERISVVAE